MGRPRLGNRIEIVNDVAIIHLHRRDDLAFTTRVDTEDVPRIEQYTWYADKNSNSDDYYAKSFAFIQGKKTSVRLHRVIMDAPAGMHVDHINHDTLDNRKCNLRIATPSENSQNLSGARSHSRSGIRGVFWNKEWRKWQVQVRVQGKLMHVGYFTDIKDAEIAAIDARSKYLPFAK